MRHKLQIYLSYLLVFCFLVFVCNRVICAEPVKVGVSIWTGWMPIYLMEEKGFLKKRSQEYGVEIKLKKFKDYLASVQAFTAGELDACAMTIMDALPPADAGIDVTAVLVNDFSKGGDGILVQYGIDGSNFKGVEVLLEEYSVSHYLLLRYLETIGLTEKDIKVKNTPGDDAGRAFLAGNAEAVATWNPHLFLAEDAGRGYVLFNSKKIPGEIIDLVVFNNKRLKQNPKAAQAFVSAWYDAMDMIKNPETRQEAISIMSELAGTKPAEFSKMLEGTDLFLDSQRAVAFLNSEEIRKTEKKVVKFAQSHGLINDEVKLRYDATVIRTVRLTK